MIPPLNVSRESRQSLVRPVWGKIKIHHNVHHYVVDINLPADLGHNGHNGHSDKEKTPGPGTGAAVHAPGQSVGLTTVLVTALLVGGIMSSGVLLAQHE
jgi:hypothetical protein